jgi:hypothetical protein
VYPRAGLYPVEKNLAPLPGIEPRLPSPSLYRLSYPSSEAVIHKKLNADSDQIHAPAALYPLGTMLDWFLIRSGRNGKANALPLLGIEVRPSIP